MSETLTQQDVQRLLADPSSDTRSEMATKIAGQFTGDSLTPNERALAEEIFRLMARDAAVRVRQALSSSLKASQTLPHDIAVALARDVEEVSLPFIEVSSVLTDADLVELIASGSVDKQVAVAQRPTLSPAVSSSLADIGAEKAVAALLANEGAQVSDASLTRALDRFEGSQSVLSTLVERGALPITIAERLVTLVSEQMRQRLVEKHELPANVASDVVIQGREKATVGLAGVASDAQLEMLVNQLYLNGRLTPSLLLRSLCMGDMSFFEAGVAQLAHVPTANARLLIHDAGQLGLRSLFDKAGLPRPLLAGALAALQIARETQFDGGDHDIERHRRRMLERILTQIELLSDGSVASEDQAYLMQKLSDLTVTLQP